MQAEAPQVPLNENHNWFHPSNLLILTVNGIARLEHWRQNPQPSAHGLRMLERVRAREADRRQWDAQREEIGILKLRALGRPDVYQEGLFEAQRVYHFARAEALGNRALGIEQSGSRFSSLRKSIIERKRAYHEAKARQAAAGLLKLG